MKHIMVDLETLAISPRSVILSVGMNVFTLTDDEPITQYYAAVNVNQQTEKDREINDDTMEWWDKQSESAKKVFTEPTKNVDDVCRDILNFMKPYRYQDHCVWGNGPDFDIVILRTFFEDFGYNFPIDYRKVRCYRTIWNIYRVNVDKNKLVHHNSLDDAIYQSNVLKQIAKQYNLNLQ